MSDREDRRLSDELSDSFSGTIQNARELKNDAEKLRDLLDQEKHRPDPYEDELLRARRAEASGAGRNLEYAQGLEAGKDAALTEGSAAGAAGSAEAAGGTAAVETGTATAVEGGVTATGGAAAAAAAPEIAVAAAIIAAIILVLFFIVSITAYVTGNTDIEKQYEEAVEAEEELGE